jgi:5'-nucleotidase
VIFDPQSPEDDSLETAFRETGVQPYRVLERGGLKVGIFGIMGKRAAEVAPFARPVRFADPVEIARHTVGDLREKERVDLVVCLAHSGLTEEGEGEATTLARKVPGIDVMVSGHTHTILSKPVLAGKTWIVQAGSCGRNVGVLDLEVEGKDCRMIHYALIPVDDRIPGDSRVQADVEELRAKVEEQFLRPLGVTYQEPLAKISFPLTQEPWGESNLGDFVSDAIRWAMDRHEVRPDDPATRTRAAVQSNGVLRDPLLPGRRGILALCDLFRAIPLGFGPDGEMGYPLLAMYITAAEIRKALEVLTSVASMRGTDYMLQISGIRFSYNPRRVPLDRVTEVLIQEASGEFVPLDTSSDNPALYKVGVNLYNAAFLKVIGRFTHGILTVIPKDRSGRPVQDLAEALLDKDPKAPGVQELKEWEALVAYLRHFPDRDGDGLPEIPEAYRSPQGRIMALPTWNPMLWFRNARWVTWAALGVVLAGFFVIGFSGWIVYRLVVRKSAGDR